MEKGAYIRYLRNSTEDKLLQQAVINKRRITLKKVLIHYMGLRLSREQPDLHLDDIEYAGLGEELVAVSRNLGIEAAQVPHQAEPIEIEINGIAFALDSEPKFNKYRGQTLESSVYKLPLIQNMDRYKTYCQLNTFQAEGGDIKTKDRLRFEKKTLPSEDFFKFQAINDFMQDLLPLVHFVPVLRFSIFDKLETSGGFVSMQDILLEDNSVYFRLLADHISIHIKNIEDKFNLDY